MNLTVPSPEEVRAALASLAPSQLQRLAKLSGVPFHTLRKVQSGETKSPGIETVRAFARFIKAASKA
jgi:transcriptional regulator with XRE-family HTH domain